jgi:hypothetical protein
MTMPTDTSSTGRDRYERTDLEVCVVCLHLLANGEFNDGTDSAEIAAAGMHRIWGDDTRHLIADGAELGFSTSACESCGDTDHGDRYRAVALIPTRGGEQP